MLVGNGGLVRKDGGVYSCAMGPDDLPGLRAWTLVSVSDGDNLQWSIDMNECDAAANQQANPAMEPVKRQRAEQRHKTSPILVALMAIGEELLLGFHNSVNNKDEVAFKWLGSRCTSKLPINARGWTMLWSVVTLMLCAES